MGKKPEHFGGKFVPGVYLFAFDGGRGDKRSLVAQENTAECIGKRVKNP